MEVNTFQPEKPEETLPSEPPCIEIVEETSQKLSEISSEPTDDVGQRSNPSARPTSHDRKIVSHDEEMQTVTHKKLPRSASTRRRSRSRKTAGRSPSAPGGRRGRSTSMRRQALTGRKTPAKSSRRSRSRKR